MSQSFDVSEQNKDISYFFYMKGCSMFFEGFDTYTEKGLFLKGTAVFFSGKSWFGSAPVFSDIFQKNYK